MLVPVIALALIRVMVSMMRPAWRPSKRLLRNYLNHLLTKW